MADLTRAQMRQLIQNLLGDDNAVMYPDDLVNMMINRAQLDVAREMEAVVKSAIVTDLVNGEWVFPSDYMHVKKVSWNGVALWPHDPDFVRRQSNIPTGTPFSFYPWGQSLRFYPAPSSNSGLSIVVDYVSVPADLTDDADTSELNDAAVKAIVYNSVRQLKFRDEDYEGRTAASEEYSSAIIAGKYDRTLVDNTSYTAIRPWEDG